jgi:hypothetical protein
LKLNPDTGEITSTNTIKKIINSEYIIDVKDNEDKIIKSLKVRFNLTDPPDPKQTAIQFEKFRDFLISLFKNKGEDLDYKTITDTSNIDKNNIDLLITDKEFESKKSIWMENIKSLNEFINNKKDVLKEKAERDKFDTFYFEIEKIIDDSKKYSGLSDNKEKKNLIIVINTYKNKYNEMIEKRIIALIEKLMANNVLAPGTTEDIWLKYRNKTFAGPTLARRTVEKKSKGGGRNKVYTRKKKRKSKKKGRKIKNNKTRKGKKRYNTRKN